MSGENTKLCECGCGDPAPIAARTKLSHGYVKGEPCRFIHGHHARGVSGPAHNQWKNGRIRHTNGYMTVHVGKEHSMANSKGYAYEHRLILADYLGRDLLKTELVHHIDLDPTNNALENLLLVSMSQHMSIHNLIRHGKDPLAAVRAVLE